MIDNHPSDLEPETILNETREAAERLGRRLLRPRGALLRGWRLRNGRFEEHLYVVWAEPLDYYELCLYLANKCGAFFNKSYGAQAALENNSKFYALIRLHSGATRVAGEIYALLLSGYPSGAYARWRTLHEISVTAMFVAQESKEVAERYIDHQAIKDYEDMKNYAKYEPSVPNKVAGLAGIEKLCRELLQVYGNDFRRPYGWAHPVIKKRLALSKGQRIGFEHLQAAVQIEHWSPWYRMASHAVHPTATFLHRNIGLRDELDDEVLLAGRSDFGLADPGQGAVMSLVGASAALLSYKQTTLETLNADMTLVAMVSALRDLSKVATEAFANVHEAVEKELSKGGGPDLAPESPHEPSVF